MTQASDLDLMPLWLCQLRQHLGIVLIPLSTILDGGMIFLLKFTHPPTPNKPDIDPDCLDPLKIHCREYYTLGYASKIFFWLRSCSRRLPCFKQQGHCSSIQTPQISTTSTLQMKTMTNKLIMGTMEVFCRSPCPKSIGNDKTLS